MRLYRYWLWICHNIPKYLWIHEASADYFDMGKVIVSNEKRMHKAM